jgi:hypothetical protein
VTFGGGTTLSSLAISAGGPNVVAGIGGALLGDVVGIDVDVGLAPGYFHDSGDRHLLSGSGVTMFTGNVVIGVPRHLTAYTLRPYFVGGAGLVHARIDDLQDVFSVRKTLPAVDVGGGVTGFLSNRTGLSWELRYFRSVGGNIDPLAISPLPEQLSFWRASMALVVRY